MNKTLPCPNGFTLSYAVYGTGDGFPILINHGLIASIRDAGLFQRLIAAGRQVICVARPGYGASSAYEMKNVAEWGDIVSRLLDHLNITQCDLLGISSGAPYSYAIGSQVPDRVRNIYIFSGTPALYADEILALWPYPPNRNATIAELQKLAYELFFSHLSADALAHHDIQDSMMNDCYGIAQDLKIRCLDWGFTLSDIKIPVYMQHSRTDGDVPFLTAEMTARYLPNCKLEIRENGAHFSGELLDHFIQKTILGE